jgi:hypothetical protein
MLPINHNVCPNSDRQRTRPTRGHIHEHAQPQHHRQICIYISPPFPSSRTPSPIPNHPPRLLPLPLHPPLLLPPPLPPPPLPLPNSPLIRPPLLRPHRRLNPQRPRNHPSSRRARLLRPPLLARSERRRAGWRTCRRAVGGVIIGGGKVGPVGAGFAGVGGGGGGGWGWVGGFFVCGVGGGGAGGGVGCGCGGGAGVFFFFFFFFFFPGVGYGGFGGFWV